MEINIKVKLDRFIEESKGRFPNITELQKKDWANQIEQNIIMSLDDNDIFYDNMPEDVGQLH